MNYRAQFCMRHTTLDVKPEECVAYSSTSKNSSLGRLATVQK